MNNSGIKPVGRAVLLKPYAPEEKKSIIQIPDFVKDRHRLLDTQAIVVEIGPYAWAGEGTPRASVGDIVQVSQFSGAMIPSPVDGEIYRLVNGQDIIAVISIKVGE